MTLTSLFFTCRDQAMPRRNVVVVPAWDNMMQSFGGSSYRTIVEQPGDRPGRD
ncbi:hypothetical protein [Sphingomonas sp. CV7422]|uniref:hypothetical protein n=1 Tax=Sphingomonas sp. CV7422 TaxID=3018036 RepID=UPI0022FE8B3D|nr:hypothetical protein [Sphingomonas sp. CV7422]